MFPLFIKHAVIAQINIITIFYYSMLDYTQTLVLCQTITFSACPSLKDPGQEAPTRSP